MKNQNLLISAACGVLLSVAGCCHKLATQPSQAAAPKPTYPTTQEAMVPYLCRWAPSSIEIDGKADDAAWKAAPWITYFQKGWKEGEDRRPKMPTRAKLLWDAEYLYFYGEMDDGDLYANTNQHQGLLWFGDVFEIFLKPAEDKPAYYEFEFNPANATLELAFPGRGLAKFETVLNGTKIEVKTAVAARGTVNQPEDRDEGWAVEGRIRWKDLILSSGRPAEGDAWRFALCRNDTAKDRKDGELSSSAPLSVPNFHHYEDYGLIRFVK